MRKRSMTDEKENYSSTDGKKTDSSQKQKRPKETYYTVQEFVREDVYLINRKSKLDRNLLANSLTAKLKQSIPGEVAINGGLMQKIRRESLRDLVQLNNLNKQIDSEMHMETNRIDSQSQQLVRRQEQMRRQSEYLRKNQDKIRSQIRGRSGDTSSKVSSLPSLKMSPSVYLGTAMDNDSRNTCSRESSRNSAKKRKDLKSNFHMFPVEYENEDPTFVKHFKHMGLFQPHNKYPHLNDKQHPEKSILRKSYGMPEYEILTLSMNEADLYSEDGSSVSSKQDQRSQKKKGLRVTWTGIDRESDDKSATTFHTQSQSPTESVSVKSFKSDSVIQPVGLTKTEKSKVDSIGIKWKLPPQGMRPSSHSAGFRSRKISHNLMPCASAMNKFGTSITKQKWAVPAMTSNISTYELYKNWLEKLEILKNPNEGKLYQQHGVNQTSNESVSYTVPVTTERPPVSVYTV